MVVKNDSNGHNLRQNPFMWVVMNTLLALVAIPNLIGILILALKKPDVIEC
jgi:Na+/alanine symporter